jgi:enoyl-CoA hydratase/carnithine racemase
MSDFALYELHDSIATITLSRPERRNAIGSQADCDCLVSAIRRAGSDPAVACVILTGAETAFCAGGNVKTMLDRDGMTRGESPATTRDNYRKSVHSIPRALYDIEVPTIAAVNGPAIGLGCDLALMCDIRIASDKAQFAESFVKVGLVPGDGGAWLLSHAIGYSRAAELTFTGDSIDAQQARELGLVSRVVAHSELLAAAQAIARKIAANPRKAVRLSKRLLRESQHSRLSDVLELSAAYQALAHETADHAEAVHAFIEKRTPTFQGK